MAAALALPADVAVIWHSPLTTAETEQVAALIAIAAAKLRQATPFSIDDRVALFATTPTDPTALDPAVVANVVATIVKRFLVNPDGQATVSETVGPYAKSGTFVNRYDKTGSDVRGAIQVTESDIDQLRPAVPAMIPSSIRMAIPSPQVLVPNSLQPGGAVVPDVFIGHDTE